MQYDSQNLHNSMISMGYSPKNSNLELKPLVSPIKLKGSNKSNFTNSKNNLLNVNTLNRNTSINIINVNNNNNNQLMNNKKDNQSNLLITPTTKKDSFQSNNILPPIINSPNYTKVQKNDKSIESLLKKNLKK